MAGITFAGEGSQDVSIDVSNADSKGTSTGSNGPIESPVSDPGKTVPTSNQQKWPNLPSNSGKGIDFVEGGARD